MCGAGARLNSSASASPCVLTHGFGAAMSETRLSLRKEFGLWQSARTGTLEHADASQPAAGDLDAGVWQQGQYRAAGVLSELF